MVITYSHKATRFDRQAVIVRLIHLTENQFTFLYNFEWSEDDHLTVKPCNLI